MARALGELRGTISHVETKQATLKKYGQRTVQVVGEKIQAVERACALTVQSLTAQLTA